MSKKQQQRIADALYVWRQTGAVSALHGVVPYTVNSAHVVAKAPMPQATKILAKKEMK